MILKNALKDDFSHLFLKTTKKKAKIIDEIHKNQKPNHNLFRKKNNIFFYFILQGLQIEIQKNNSHETLNTKEFIDRTNQIMEGRNYDAKLLSISNLIQDFGETVFYIVFQICPDFKILETTIELEKIITYLFNQGFDTNDQLERMNSKYICDLLIKDLDESTNVNLN